MSVFFPTPLLDYTEKFNRQYEIEQKRIQEMQKHRAEYYENKNGLKKPSQGIHYPK